MEVIVILGAVSIAISLYLLYTFIDTVLGLRSVINLKIQSLSANLPSVSIIISACNEEEKIQETLEKLLALNYPNFEVIAIDDRSTDRTFAIMSQLEAKYKNLRIFQIKELPPFWFGKNHALNFAAARAQNDWLLFSDADIDMKSELLAKAMSYVLTNKLDHLTIAEYHTNKKFWLNVVLFGQYLTSTMICKPWYIRRSFSKRSWGYGAFNLVNKKSYHACGAHQAIAMECLDDVMLGALIKSQGYKQDIVDGRDYLQREWYSSLPTLLAGMKKKFCRF